MRHPHSSTSPVINEASHIVHCGLSKRDLLAAMAMQGLLSNTKVWKEKYPESIPEDAYEMADDMIAFRQEELRQQAEERQMEDGANGAMMMNKPTASITPELDKLAEDVEYVRNSLLYIRTGKYADIAFHDLIRLRGFIDGMLFCGGITKEVCVRCRHEMCLELRAINLRCEQFDH